MRRLPAAAAFLLLALLAGRAEQPLEVATWNTRQLDAGVDFAAFMESVREAEVVVLQELLGEEHLDGALRRAGARGWHRAVSDFTKDSYRTPTRKLEVAILSRYPFSEVIEADPYAADDSEEMRARDIDLVAPALLPADQRRNLGSRGWLWARIPELRLVVAAVHLKSSLGRVGAADEANSFKREGVIASLGVAILEDLREKDGWSYVVAGDFNVAPGDPARSGWRLEVRSSPPEPLRGYDQTHALLERLIAGLRMRNLTREIPSSFVGQRGGHGAIDCIYALGELVSAADPPRAERGGTFGSDHHMIVVRLR